MLRMSSRPQRAVELLQAFRSLMRPAHAEKGFIACRVCFEADDPNTVCYEERWETREDFERQVRSPRYTRIMALMEYAAEQPTLEMHFVSQTKGLDYIAAVRKEKASEARREGPNTNATNQL